MNWEYFIYGLLFGGFIIALLTYGYIYLSNKRKSKIKEMQGPQVFKQVGLSGNSKQRRQKYKRLKKRFSEKHFNIERQGPGQVLIYKND